MSVTYQQIRGRKGPVAVAAWWSSLADAEFAADGQLSDAQREVLANHADLIGPLAGVPVEYRDEARARRCAHHSAVHRPGQRLAARGGPDGLGSAEGGVTVAPL